MAVISTHDDVKGEDPKSWEEKKNPISTHDLVPNGRPVTTKDVTDYVKRIDGKAKGKKQADAVSE